MRARFCAPWCGAAERQDAANPRELWRLLTAASPEELRPVVAGTPAQPFLDPDNARMFGSIRSVAVSAMAALEYMQSQRAAPFSVRQWVRRANDSRRAVHSVQGRADRGAPLDDRDLDAARDIRGDERRGGSRPALWFVVDELDALGAIDGLKDALARLRKFGGRCVLGISVNRPGLRHLWAERRANHCRKLRQYADFALLRQRERRHLAIRLPADRRTRGR